MYQTICRSHADDGTINPQWLEARRTGVTATDVAKLLSGGSWIDLWARKTGRVESEDMSDNERVRFGNLLEGTIVHAYGLPEYSGRPTRRSNELIRSAQYPWMLATLDAVTVHPKIGEIPLEAKNADRFMEDRWAEGPPDQYTWQNKAQALCMGTQLGSIVCLLGGNRLMWADTELTDADKVRLLSTAEKFWWYVQNDIPPSEVDALPETRKALDATYTPTDGTVLTISDPELVRLDAEYEDLVAQLDQYKEFMQPAEQRKTEIENTIRRRMGNYAELVLPTTAWRIKRIERKAYTAKASSYTRLTRVAP